jgi:hypothetical protein
MSRVERPALYRSSARATLRHDELESRRDLARHIVQAGARDARKRGAETLAVDTVVAKLRHYASKM